MANAYKGTVFDLSGRTAAVTGAAQGLGRAMALALASAGADVVISDINQEKGKRTSKEIESFGNQKGNADDQKNIDFFRSSCRIYHWT